MKYYHARVNFRKHYESFWYVYINGKRNKTFSIKFSDIQRKFYIFKDNDVWFIAGEYETLIEAKRALVDLLDERYLRRKLTKQKK